MLFAVLLIAVTVWFYPEEEVTPPDGISVSERKARFLELVPPAIDEVYDELTAQYLAVLSSSDSGGDISEFQALQKEYRVSSIAELLTALKPHPKSLALAQAAIESAWATSRFSVEANNLFGVWSFEENEPGMAAGKKRSDKTIWVKKHASINDSIRDYYRLLARGDTFAEFRQAKMETSDAYTLVIEFDGYSEQRAKYGRLLASVIRQNNFQRYDSVK